MRRWGLVDLGQVAGDSTKIEANASAHQAMSNKRMGAKEKELEAKGARLLEPAQRVDAAEGAKHGKRGRGDELPAPLARRKTRLRKLWRAHTRLLAT